jgi:hypothetical protein
MKNIEWSCTSAAASTRQQDRSSSERKRALGHRQTPQTGSVGPQQGAGRQARAQTSAVLLPAPKATLSRVLEGSGHGAACCNRRRRGDDGESCDESKPEPNTTRDAARRCSDRARGWRQGEAAQGCRVSYRRRLAACASARRYARAGSSVSLH